MLENVKSFGAALDMTIMDEMVDICYRLGKTVEGKLPPRIIVKFIRRVDKQTLLQKKKQEKRSEIRRPGLQGKSCNLHQRQPEPWKKTSASGDEVAKKKEKNLTFVWTTDEGKILVRKEEKGPVMIWVRNIKDVDKLWTSAIKQ